MAEAAPETLDDGSLVRIVPVRPEDRAKLRRDIVAGFARLSAESRLNRFLSGAPRLSADQLHGLVETVDNVDHVVLGLELVNGATLIGIGRFIRDEHDLESAEVAVTVADQWQGQGAGTALIQALTQAAAQRGVRRFTALVLGENEASLAMLRSAATVTECERGADTVKLTIEL